MNQSSRIFQTLNLIDAEDPQASIDLGALVYDDLQDRLATHNTLAHADHILQATVLVQSVYVEFAGPGTPELPESGAQFYLAASDAMRRILIEFAKLQVAVIGNINDPTLQTDDIRPAIAGITPGQLIRLEAALQKLEQSDNQTARLVQLRLYGGLPTTSAAKVLRIRHAYAEELWDYALAWFALELAGEQALGVDS